MVNIPNIVTICRILAIPVFIIVLFLPIPNRELVAAIIFAVIAGTDWLDGWLARRLKQVSRFGNILDPFADKLLVSAALIFLINKGVDAWMAYVIIAREFLVSALRLIAFKFNEFKVSRISKTKMLAQCIGIIAVLLKLKFAWWLMLLAVILTVISGIDYFWKARKLLAKA